MKTFQNIGVGAAVTAAGAGAVVTVSGGLLALGYFFLGAAALGAVVLLYVVWVGRDVEAVPPERMQPEPEHLFAKQEFAKAWDDYWDDQPDVRERIVKTDPEK